MLSQTHKSFELLLVDDGSTDGSTSLCDKYAAHDSRVRVFHKPNGGVSSARNLGLDNATGKWVVFIDSDDWVEPNHLEDLAKDPETDMRVCSAVVIKEDYISENRQLPDKRSIGHQALIEGLKDHYDFFLYKPWGIRYTLHKLQAANIHFHESLNFGEDNIFNLDYISVIKSISFSSSITINYDLRTEGSLSKKSPIAIECLKGIDILDTRIILLKQIYNTDIYKILKTRIFFEFFRTVQSIIESEPRFKNRRIYFKHLFSGETGRIIRKNLIGCRKGYGKHLADVLASMKAWRLRTLYMNKVKGY